MPTSTYLALRLLDAGPCVFIPQTTLLITWAQGRRTQTQNMENCRSARKRRVPGGGGKTLDQASDPEEDQTPMTRQEAPSAHGQRGAPQSAQTWGAGSGLDNPEQPVNREDLGAPGVHPRHWRCRQRSPEPQAESDSVHRPQNGQDSKMFIEEACKCGERITDTGNQQFRCWVFTRKNRKQGLRQVLAHPCPQQLHSQELKRGRSPVSIHR